MAAIRGILLAAKGPLKIQAIHADAEVNCPGLGIATVYRCLSNLCDDGVVRRFLLLDGQNWYSERHRTWAYLLHCTACGSTVAGPPRLVRRLRLPGGSACTWRMTIAEGTCPECATKRHARPSAPR